MAGNGLLDERSMGEESPAAKKPKLADSDDDVICLGSLAEDVPAVSKPHPSEICEVEPVAKGSSHPGMFYLTRVRGIAECYNQPQIAVGIKGKHSIDKGC